MLEIKNMAKEGKAVLITKVGGNILELKVDEPNLEKIFVSYLNIKEGK